MGKKLAIRGHATRGKEVIELLEMMGGKNNCDSPADNLGLCYLIDDEFDIVRQSVAYVDYEDGELNIFTLEEFWEKYPFKIGDKVIDEADGCPGVVCKMKWDEKISDMKYCVAFGNGIDFGWFANNSINYFNIKKNENLEETQSNQDIDKVVDNFRKEFCKRCGSQRCSGRDDELEDCERFKNIIDNLGKTPVKNHKMGPKSKLPSKYYEDSLEETQSKREYDELRMPIDDDDKLATEATIMGKKILPPNGYLIGKITQTDNGMLVEYVNKKPKYPKTYKECCDVLLIPPYYNLRYHTYERGYNEYATSNTLLSLADKLNTLGKLIICRNAYWKIAGEEMGLDKPWEPDWLSGRKEEKYCIATQNNEIWHNFSEYGGNEILAFPTMEMRDAFYENFKDLIEKCKELL